jgi:hypothetical protein
VGTTDLTTTQTGESYADAIARRKPADPLVVARRLRMKRARGTVEDKRVTVPRDPTYPGWTPEGHAEQMRLLAKVKASRPAARPFPAYTPPSAESVTAKAKRDMEELKARLGRTVIIDSALPDVPPNTRPQAPDIEGEPIPLDEDADVPVEVGGEL